MTDQVVVTNPDPTQNVRELVVAANLRSDDLRAAEARRVNEIMALEREHVKEMREAEAKRIDAIRAVDVSAVARATEQSAATAAILATQVQATAETLRQQFTTTTNGLSDRIGQLERTSYEGSGKSAVADPQLAKMAETMERLSQNMAEGKGGKSSRTEGRASTAALVAIVVACFVGLSLIVTIIMAAIAISKGVGA